MKIGDVIAKIGELISAVETAENNTVATPAPIIINNNPGATAPVEHQVSPNGETEAGNDKEPEDLFLPPLQQKQELLKKAVGVENIYDDGRPGDQDENADAPTPEQEDIINRIKQLSGVPVAAVQELSNDEVFDD